MFRLIYPKQKNKLASKLVGVPYKKKLTAKSSATLVQEMTRVWANKGVAGFPSSKPIICILLSHVTLMFIEW